MVLLADLGALDRGPSRQSMVEEAVSFGFRNFSTADDEERVDPIARLFDPTFTDVTWTHDRCYVNELPGKLHPKQLEALTNMSLHRWLFWGNQVGKTCLGAVDMVLSALGRHPLQQVGILRMPPFHGWASALTWEMWQNNLLPELLSWVPWWRVIDAPTPRKLSTKRDIVIRADNGAESIITGKAAEQGAGRYQSARVHKIWLDEEHPEDVYNEMLPRLLRFGGTTLASMTPLLGLTWVHGRIYEPLERGKVDMASRVMATGERIRVPQHWYSHAGLSDNPGIQPEEIEAISRELAHNPSQLAARLHGKFVRPEGAVLPWDPKKHIETITPELMTLLQMRGAWYGAVDLGKWRFAFSFGVADADRKFRVIDEYLSQNEDMTVRAKAMHKLLRAWRVPSIMIPADCADPKGIAELNECFEAIGSPYSVYAIDGALKARQAGVLRLENLMNRGAWLVRRGMGGDMVWRYRAGASGPGRPIMGSRWQWEAANWLYPKAADGKIQKDEPDDASADGADMMDTARYIAMSFFAADAPAQPRRNPTRAERIAKELEKMDQQEEEYWERRERDDDPYGGVLRQ